MTLSAHMIAAYNSLSDQELLDRMDQFERQAVELTEKIARGDVGDVVSTHVFLGERFNSHRNEVGLNVLRSAWRDCRDVLKHRGSW